MFIWVKPPQFSKEFLNIFFRHTDSRLTLTHSQNEHSEIRNPNVNHNTQNCETNLRCSEPCVCAVRTLTQFCVLCWIIHFINPQSTHTLLMSAWIRNRSPYHTWKPLHGNEKSLIEIAMRVVRVCARPVAVWATTIISASNYQMAPTRKAFLATRSCEWKCPDRLMNNNNKFCITYDWRAYAERAIQCCNNS